MSFDFLGFAPDDDVVFRDCVFHALNIPLDAWPKFRTRVGDENLRVLRSDGRLIGGLGLYRMGMWFGGKSVRCGGVTIVGIAPEFRRKGAARAMLTESLREMHRAGEPLASLYASSPTFYRGVGFEYAGNRCRFKYPLTHVGVSDRELEMTSVGCDSHEPFIRAAEARGRVTNGMIDRTPGLWERMLSNGTDPHYGYIIGDPAEPEGFLIYHQKTEGSDWAQLVIRDVAALTPRAARRLWSFLGDHASISDFVTWSGPANEPLLTIPAEARETKGELIRWMLRIVRVDDALTERGYAPDTSAELNLQVTDELLPENSGGYRLTVAEGTATVERIESGDLKCTIQGLAPLYSGLFSAGELRRLGFIDGPDDAIRTADQIFAGSEPWMPEIF